MKIIFINGPECGTEKRLEAQNITIGRDSSNLICLGSGGVSRCHAKISRNHQDRWTVQDLRSTNGVKVNGVRISGEKELVEGDKLTIGEQELQVFDLDKPATGVIFNPIITAPIPEELPNTPEQTVKTIDLNQVPKNAPAAAPASSSVFSSGASPSAEKNVGGESLLHSLSGSLFSGDKSKAKKEEAAEGKDPQSAAEKKKRFSNFVFYVVVACVVIMVLSTAFNLMSPKTAAKAAKSYPTLEIRYEKEVLQNSNIFRFEFHLVRRFEAKSSGGSKKADRASAPKKAPTAGYFYFALFTLDDLGSKRHFQKEVQLSDESVEQLRNAVRSSGIFGVNNKAAGVRDSFMNRSLIIVEGVKIQKLQVPGEFADNEFSAVEDAIVGIAENFGFQTIILTPEQLKEQATNNLLKAEDLFTNRAKPENLRDAIILYRAVIRALEQVTPEPPERNLARKQLKAAEAERSEKLRYYESEYNRARQINDYEGARKVLLSYKDLVDPESRAFYFAKKQLIQIDQLLRKKRK